mgnify:CR=1 FL=1
MKVKELLKIIEVEKVLVIYKDYIENFKWNNWDSFRDYNDIKLEEKYGEYEIEYISINKYNEFELAIK